MSYTNKINIINGLDYIFILGAIFVSILHWIFNINISDAFLIIVITYLILRKWFFRYKKLEFITETKMIDIAIEDIFYDAEEFIYIVSPYFDIGENRLKNLMDAKNLNVEVNILIHPRTTLNSSSKNQLLKLKENGCDIRVHPNLHSKIYLNEKSMIIGSPNLNKGSFDNSLEVGVFSENHYEIEEIIEKIKYDYFKDPRTYSFEIDNLKTGFCIRTKTIENYNLKRPINRDEYFKSNKNIKGKFCHACGKIANTSLNQPLCDKCVNIS